MPQSYSLLCLHADCIFFLLSFLFQPSDAGDAPYTFKQRCASLEQALGLYEAAFCDSTQPLPDVDSVRATPSPSDASVNVFEKQDPTTQIDCASCAPPLKRSRRYPQSPPELKGPHRRLGRPPNKTLSQKTPHGKIQSEQSHPKREMSSSEEGTILSQHHNAALCVC